MLYLVLLGPSCSLRNQKMKKATQSHRSSLPPGGWQPGIEQGLGLRVQNVELVTQLLVQHPFWVPLRYRTGTLRDLEGLGFKGPCTHSIYLLVQYPGDLKVNVREQIGTIQGLQYPRKVKGCLLYYQACNCPIGTLVQFVSLRTLHAVLMTCSDRGGLKSLQYFNSGKVIL